MKKLIILLVSVSLFGQQGNQSNKNINLETVNLYSSFIDLNAEESGKNVTVINTIDLDNYSFNSIDELLKLIPSIELQSRGGFGTQSDLVLRGTTFNQSLVLLDGMRINDPLTGHFSMYVPINPYEIYQIEIIRGGGSSVYGPDAVGGIINIITKTFIEDYNNDEIKIESKFGQYNLKSLNFHLSKKISNSLFSSISGNRIKSDGQELYDDVFSFFDNRNISTSHRIKIGKKINLMLRSSYSKSYFNSQYYYTRSSFDLSNETIEKTWNQLKLNYKIDSYSQIDFLTAFQSTSDLYVFNPDFPVYENKTNLLSSKINYVMKKDQHRLVGGFEFQNRGIVSLDRGSHEDVYFGGYINLMKRFYKIVVNPSLRIDYNKAYKIQLCPQFDVNYNNSKYKLRFSAGRTIRSADFTERFYNNDYSDTLSPGRNIGNPDLRSENSLNLELGFDYKKFKNILFKSTIFYRQSTNLIDWVILNSNEIETSINLFENESYLFAQNISKLNTLGLETEIWFDLLREKKIKINGSIGYLKIFSAETSENIFNESTLSSKYLANNSGDVFNYNLIFHWKKIKLNFNGKYKNRDNETEIGINQELTKSYFVHNFNLNYNVNKHGSINFELINVLNTNYADILGAIMPKRWSVIGVKYTINNRKN